MRVLSAASKSFKIFRLVDRNDAFLNLNVRLEKINGVVIMPIVERREDVADIIKKLFGIKGYYKYFPRYLYEKRFTYQPTFHSGPKIIVAADNLDIISRELPNLRNDPTYRYLDGKNTILDCSDQFRVMLPPSFTRLPGQIKENILVKPNVLKYCENIYPELITRFALSNSELDKFNYTSRYMPKSEIVPLNEKHNALIVTIDVKSVKPAIAAMFLDYNKRLPRDCKIQREDLFTSTMARFAYRSYIDGEESDDKGAYNDSLNYYLKEFKEKHVIFVFHNKYFAFVVDPVELRAKNINNKSYFNLLKSRLITIIKNNIGAIGSDDIDKQILEEEKVEKEQLQNEIKVTLNKTVVINENPVYEEPKSFAQIADKDGSRQAIELAKDPVQKFRMESGIEVIYPTKSVKEQVKLYNNWKLLTPEQKITSDKKSKEIYGLDNETHHKKLLKELEKTIEPHNDDIVDNTESELNSKISKLMNNRPTRSINSNSLVKDSTSKILSVLGQKKTPIISGITETLTEADYNYTKEEDNEEDEIELETNNDDFTGFDSDEELRNQDELDDEYEKTIMEQDIPEEVIEEYNNGKKEPILYNSNDELSDEDRKAILDSIKVEQQPKRTPKELRRIAIIKDKYKSIKVDDTRTIEELIEDVEAKAIEHKVVDSPTIIDKSVTKMNLLDVERSYVKKTMKQDLVNVVKSLSSDEKSIKMHIIDYKEEDTSDRFNNKSTMTFKLEDENHKRHTIKVDIPTPDEDGLLYIGGNKKILKKQMTFIPVVKIKPDLVIITTFDNKVMIERVGNTVNYSVNVIKTIVSKYFTEDLEHFEVIYGDSLKLNKDFITSIDYDDLSTNYYKLSIGKGSGKLVFFFNQKEIRTEIYNKMPSYTFSPNKLPFGIDYKTNEVLEFDLVHKDVPVSATIINKIIERGLIPDLEAKISKIKVPKRRLFSRVTIISRDIPLIAVLGFLFGLKNVMIVNKVKYTFSSKVLQGDRRLFIRFKDGILYYDEYPMDNAILMNGLGEVMTEDYNFDDFDTQTPYVDYIYKAFKSRNMVKGLTSFRELFLTNVDKEILRDYNFPTDFLELFLYANSLLADNQYTTETRSENYRIRSFEMVSVALHKAIAKEYKTLKQRGNTARMSLSIPETAVMTALNESQIFENYDLINPINFMKLKSTTTFKGNGLGGTQMKHGFTLEKRNFGEDSTGIVALTVPESNTGITKQLVANPRIINTRGSLETVKTKKDVQALGASEMMSPDELIMPFVQKVDHPNRVGFSGGQYKHTGGVNYNCVPLVGNGFEKTIAGQCDRTFAVKARENGIILEINDEMKKMVVEYKDGSKEIIDYGTHEVRNSSYYIENTLIPNVKVGQKVKENEVLAYAKEFFVKQGEDLTFTMGVIARVALLDSLASTEEDSSLLSSQMSKWMSNPTIKKDTISISKDCNIIRYAKVGDKVVFGDHIFVYEDFKEEGSTTEIMDLLGKVDEATLEDMIYHMPKAHSTGTIMKIDVFWSVDPSEMSESCRNFVNSFVKAQKKIIDYEEKSTGKTSPLRVTLKTTPANRGRVNGSPVPDEGGLVIEYYVIHNNELGIGSKSSVYPALKTVCATAVTDEKLDPYGDYGRIDMCTSFIGLSNRKVNSTLTVGYLGKILYHRSKEIASEFLDKPLKFD